jgi:hypothetical protein
MGLSEAQRGRLGQGFYEGMERRKRQVESRSELLAELAHPFFQGHRPWQEAIGRLQCGVACARQEACALPQQVEDAVGIFFIRFTRAVLPGLPMVPHGWAGHQADLLATAFEPCVEGRPVDTGWCHRNADPLLPVCDQVGLQGLCKTSEALTGGSTCKLMTAHGGLRPQTSLVLGFAHIDANEEPGRVVYVRFTLVGISSILVQSHGTYLHRG